MTALNKYYKKYNYNKAFPLNDEISRTNEIEPHSFYRRIEIFGW